MSKRLRFHHAAWVARRRHAAAHPVPAAAATRWVTPRATTGDPVWEIYRGLHKYYLVGPGPGAMVPISAPDYSKTPPKLSLHELQCARRAIKRLKARFPGSAESATVADIREALTPAAK